MIHRYFPHTSEDIAAMLERCGMKSLDELYSDIPESLKLKRNYDLQPQMSEKEVRDFFEELAVRNQPLTCFAGAGFYDHYTPAVVQSLASRSEFLTAYTPYQPEISQGTLQYIFEYQSMMTQLTGLSVSNASMYDGTTAVAEAMLMAVAHARKKNRVLVSATLNPIYREVVDTYAHYHGIVVDTIPESEGVTDLNKMREMLSAGDVAGVIVATPNFYGILEDYTGVADMVHAAKALLIMTAPASALGVIRTPGEWGADIAAGEAQSLGMPLNFGGPYLGYICCTKALIRKLPGRIVGATTDADGRRVFVLTLQAREQHIRRDKATSNICSNQGLMALYVAMYLSLMGAKGLREVNELSTAGAHYLASRLVETGAFELKYPDKPFLNEFVVKFKGEVKLADFVEVCNSCGCLPGVMISDSELLVCVTETRTKEEIDRYIWRAETFSKATVPAMNGGNT
ncbi:MAG: aminomethyl-transferring glycine dehydrogenase subunit GcvPA, partial [Duncaniella sp.]|nr:aminomethyl-transferring glycine dehydrogenase subunit GcvPA [Duncaniella sp.]